MLILILKGGNKMLFENYSPLNKKMFQIMDENSNIINEDYMPNLNKEEMLAMYENMIQGREADLKALIYQRQGRMLTYAPNIGQEAAQVGSAFALEKRDWMVPSFRELGAWLTRGADLKMIYLYWYGNEFGSYMPVLSPKDPKLVIVNVLPLISSNFNFFSLAASLRRILSTVNFNIPLLSAFFITGTTNPSSVSTAIPIL